MLWMISTFTSALAREATSDESDFLGDIPTVLTASRLIQPVSQAPAPVSIIDRKMIEASGATDIAELLRLVPGFLVVEQRGGWYTTSYRTFGNSAARYFQIMVDGVSIYKVELGEVYWWSLPLALDDVERIEVVRSPNAAGYGSNAFQGVINILTREPAAGKGAYANLQAATHDGQQARMHYSGGNGQTDFRAMAGYKHSTGFADLPDTLSQAYANLRSDVQLTASDGLQIALGASDSTIGMGNYGSVMSPPHNAQTSEQMLQLRWNRALADEADLTLRYGHTGFRVKDEFSADLPAPVGSYPISYSFHDARDSLEFTHRLHPTADTRLAWGMEMRRDAICMDVLFYGVGCVHGDVTRLFGNGDWHASEAVTVHAGAMLEHNQTASGNLYPRLALNYRLAPGHTLRASISKGFRPPALGEKNIDARLMWNGMLLNQVFVPSLNLKSERVTSREIGYLAEIPRYRINLDTRISVDSYRDMISRQSVALPLGTELSGEDAAFIFANAIQATVEGAELQMRWQPAMGSLLVANYAYTRIRSNDANTAQSGPRQILSLLASHQLSPAISANASYYRFGAMRWVSFTEYLSNGTSMDKYERLDLKLAYRLQPGRNSDELALVVRNALDRHNETLGQGAVERREALLSLTLNF